MGCGGVGERHLSSECYTFELNNLLSLVEHTSGDIANNDVEHQPVLRYTVYSRFFILLGIHMLFLWLWYCLGLFFFCA